MKTGVYLSTFLLFFVLFQPSISKEITVSTPEELQAVFKEPSEYIVVHLLPGEYHLTPVSAIDSTCGNCEDPETPVQVTIGLRISGLRVEIFGPEDRSAVIHTHAGYGLYFENCDSCLVKNLSITGGERDPDGNATDAAIIVKNGYVSVINNRIHDNIGDSTVVSRTVVGIMGVCGREGSHLQVTGNEIVRNSWDGIALYRHASASISGNLIDGVDKAKGSDIGGGRGVGIGVTWNAFAKIEENLVKRYWKGIGIFVDAKAEVRRNIVEDVLTWGIAYWDAGKGSPIGIFEDNIIFHTGACGASITRSAPLASGEPSGGFVRNMIVKTGQNPKYDDAEYYCFQCALALHEVPEGFVIKDNLFYDNRRAGEDLPDWDLDTEGFEAASRRFAANFKETVFLKESNFLRMYLRFPWRGYTREVRSNDSK